MPQEIKIVSVSIPAGLVRELDRVCDLEHRNRSELYREALRQYLKLRRWQALREYSSAKAAAAGGNGVDIEKLIEELSL
ncbi:MAG: ribbon-helix-helix protein, CopG family [Planctomycetes bacterium]|nr:ribbon-helix-helix protein, CopG family [Planctomycetota bacterium]